VVVDTSAVSAILFGETDSERFISALASSGRKFMSAVNRLESAIVVEARKGEGGAKALAQLLAVSEIEILPFDSSQAEIALGAWRRYGKGRHPAGLNLGDCASYALSATLNRPLLFKGDDFTKTDIAEYPASAPTGTP
jgi:ribonuclease VapC